MKKIPSLFQRDRDTGDRLVRDEIVPGSEWVAAGEGMATAKWDGTACLIKDGILHRRYDAKHGKRPPPLFVPAQEADAVTGHWPGWVPCGTEPDSRWHWEAKGKLKIPDGTYELVGPKINGNPHGMVGHVLIPHGETAMPNFPRDFEGVRLALADIRYEGVVWHHGDGRMCKVKRKDFGLPWPVKA